MRYLSIGFLVAIVAGLVILVGLTPPRWTAAHGTVDQENVGPPSGTASINLAAPLGQEFTPTVASLVAVDLDVATANPGSGDGTISLLIRDSTIDGPVLGATSIAVADGFMGWLHIDLVAPVTLVPGQTYVIALESTTITHSWQLTDDTYPGGRGIMDGNPQAVTDWRFRTYGAEPTPTPTPIPTPTSTSEPTPTPTSTSEPTPTATPAAPSADGPSDLPATGAEPRPDADFPSVAVATYLAAGLVLVGAGGLCVARARRE